MVLVLGGTYPVLRLEIRGHNDGDWTLGDLAVPARCRHGLRYSARSRFQGTCK